MQPATLVVVLILVVAVIIALAAVVYTARRRAHLKAQFGPEYERTVVLTGNAKRAEAELEARAHRVSRYHIKPLSEDDSHRFASAWRQLQSRFVDQPTQTVADADVLVGEVMAKRGYPMAEFEERAEDLSVDHPTVVTHYREAHQIAVRQADANRTTSTEDLRQALVHYRALFEDLLGGVNGKRRNPA